MFNMVELLTGPPVIYPLVEVMLLVAAVAIGFMLGRRWGP